MEVDEVPAHQCISLFYLHSPFKVISPSLSFSSSPSLSHSFIILALLPLSIDTYYRPARSTPPSTSRLPSAPSISPPLCPEEGQKKKKGKRAEGRNARKTQRHTMKPFICPIKETEAQRKVNIHLSHPLSLSVSRFSPRVRERP